MAMWGYEKLSIGRFNKRIKLKELDSLIEL